MDQRAAPVLHYTSVPPFYPGKPGARCQGAGDPGLLLMLSVLVPTCITCVDQDEHIAATAPPNSYTWMPTNVSLPASIFWVSSASQVGVAGCRDRSVFCLFLPAFFAKVRFQEPQGVDLHSEAH